MARALVEQGAYILPGGVAGLALEVPVAFHVVRTSAGTGGLSQGDLDQVLVDANAAFFDMGISFFQAGATDHIDSDAFYFDIDTLAEIDQLRTTNVIPHAINTYFTENLATENGSICGTSSFTFSDVQGIVVKNACTGTTNPSTVAHELGHYFDLFHTHETALGVECVDGSNCDDAGDLFCDTPADPNLSGQVDEGCLYTGGEPGPCAGDPPYDPDTTNIMSYSRKLCRDNFTQQQADKAVATLMNLRPDLLDPWPPFNDDCDAALLVVGGDTPFTTIGATTDGFDESGTCDLTLENDVWFRTFVLCEGTLRITISGSDYNHAVAVYFGLSCPTGPDQAVACLEAPATEIDVPVTLGQAMYLRIGSLGGGVGSGVLTLTCMEACPEDCSGGDGAVDVQDLLALLADWGGPGACDTDGSGTVDVSDLLDLLAAWGPCE